MEFTILILAGYSGVGKTTIARKIAGKYDFGFVEHQKLLHEMATVRGHLRARNWLADVGIHEFVKQSLDEMAERIKAFKEKDIKGIVTDVAYGKNMLEYLRKRFPEANLVTVFVDAGHETREGRISQRMGGVENEVALNEREFRDGFWEMWDYKRLLKTQILQLRIKAS